MQRRAEDQSLTPVARKELGNSLGALLDARRALRVDLLEDPLELTTFGVSAGNVNEVLETRLQLLEQVQEKMSASTTSAAVNEQPLATLGLSSVDLWKGYIPLACLLLEKWHAHKASGRPGAFVLGINAGPGSGKSTLVQVLLFLMSASSDRPLNVAQISSDDLYMGHHERLARHISTRLDPASLDPELFDLVDRLKHSTADTPPIELPRFNKGKDDREAVGTVVYGAFDLVLYEGWRVGVQPGQLNGCKFDYTALNDPIDFLLYIDAEPKHVFEWKLESTKRDHCREHPHTP
jgi:pantothenate kinase